MVASATARLSRSKLRNTALSRFYLLPLSGLSMTLVGCVETDTPESKETDPTVDSGWYDTPTDDDADGYTVEGGDCDDSDATINPGATDDSVDGVDQDCDEFDGPDGDGDGYADASAGGDDCDDDDATAYPGAEDALVDGVDQDCDGFDGPDADGDGFADADAGGDDCDDTNADIAPGAPELCVDGLDTDCDGLPDADDPDACPDFVGWDSADSALIDVADILIDGNAAGYFGGSLASTNLDGDSLPDIVVSAGLGDQVFVFLGTTLAGGASLGSTDADYSFVATGDERENFGRSIHTDADIDGDGLQDLVIGAYGAQDRSGAVYVFLSSSLGAPGEYTTASADHTVSGDLTDDGNTGFSLASADIDGDSVTDLILGAPASNAGGTDAGRIHVISGETIMTASESSVGADALLEITGTSATARLGWHIDTGDLDGDGSADLMATAHRTDDVATEAGAVHVWLGSTLATATALSTEDADHSIWGSEAWAELGASATMVPDLDADGMDELFIGAVGASSDAALYDGASYLFLGSALSGQQMLGPDDASSQWVGGVDYAYTGDSVALAGDLDGDGLEDLLIGGSGDNTNAVMAGAIHVVLASGIGSGTTVDLSAGASATILGERAGEFLGFSFVGSPMGSAGDPDGDGRDDLMIGTPYISNQVHIFGADQLSVSPLSVGDAALTLSLDESVATYTGDVVRGGDIDGDGLADIMVLVDHPMTAAACIFLGSGLSSGDALDVFEADYCLHGNTLNDINYVTTAGDVDGDGRDDILITAPTDDDAGNNAGKVYLLLAASLGADKDVFLEDSADYIFLGETDDGGLGGRHHSVASAGDVDGDFLDDILLGAPVDDTNGTNSGRAYLFLASSLGATRTISAADADYRFIGSGGPDYQMGGAVASAGDVDGDGIADFILGEYGWGAPEAAWPGYVGRVHLFLGASLGAPGLVDVDTSDYTFIGGGDPQRDYAGRYLDAGGDFDGDGLSDLVITAYWNSTEALGNGALYVVLGASLGADSEIQLTDADYQIRGTGELEYLGHFTSQTGDVDADGLDDLLVLSPHVDADSGTTDAADESRGTSGLFLGANLDPTSSPLFLADADYRFTGENDGDQAGEAGTIVGDVNGDGLDDIVIAAEDHNSWSGRVYVMFTP